MALLRTFGLSLLLSLAAGAASAQAPATATETLNTIPQLDVISIKPNNSGSLNSRSNFTASSFISTNLPIHMLLREAFQLNDDQILGEPTWTTSDRFDIDAKVAGPDVPGLKSLSFDQRRSMLQQILTDRFQLTFHRDTRELPVYNLVVAKGGIKFQETKTEILGPGRGSGRFTVGRGKIITQGGSIKSFLSFLSQQTSRTIVDKTGLTGNYDFTLTWTPDDGAAGSRSSDAAEAGAPPPTLADSGPSLFTAIQEQLGLKLESGKGPVPVLVIDRLERPAEN